MITTSYPNPMIRNILSGVIEACNPRVIVELGTQQGSSALLMASVLKEGHITTYDSFLEKYDLPPHLETHANKKIAIQTIEKSGLGDKISVIQEDAFKVYKRWDTVDILHVDICNYYRNVLRILEQWYMKVNQAILLEGGGNNHWQKKFGFSPFTPLLIERWLLEEYYPLVYLVDENQAITILVRKEKVHDSHV